jgi:ligand-binding sensor domain-containing protein
MIKFIQLCLFIGLQASCGDQKLSNSSPDQTESQALVRADSLKFISGIRAMLQDSKGNYWLGSDGEGVARYDGKSVRYYTTNEGLADNQVRSIQEDAQGTILIETASGVSKFNGSVMQPLVQSDNSESQWNHTDACLWFNAGTRPGVYRYDGRQLNYLSFPIPQEGSSGGSYALTAFAKGKNHMFWFATYAAVFGFNGKEWKIINDKLLPLATDSGKLHVRSLLEDKQGRLWIGNNGIGVLLKEGNTIRHFSKEQGKLLPMSTFEANTKAYQFSKNTGLQSVFAIEEDADGNIWFGDRDTGAWKYDGKTLSHYSIDNNLSSPMILDIYRDANNQLLFGMAAGGIYKFNGSSFHKCF